MALILKDRVKQQTTTTGSTDAYTLSGSFDGFDAFTEIGDGNETYYCCTDGTDFEVGRGTFTASGTTLSRAEILSSSNGDAAVNWTSGTRTIFCTQPADKAVFLDGSGNISVPGTIDGRDLASDGTKLDGIEDSADVTDTANVTAAGALMDSEVTNLADVKSFDPADYATAAQGTTADAALPKAGGTMTGNLELNNVNIVFEGSTADSNETTLTAIDPTADRTITLPDATGTARVVRRQNITANRPVGWTTIAVLEGRDSRSVANQRMIAKFTVADVQTSRHNMFSFTAQHSFGEDNGIQVLGYATFSTDSVTAIRIKAGSIYGGAAVQVYIADATNNIVVYLDENNFDDVDDLGRVILKDGIADGTDPGNVGYTTDTYAGFTEKVQIDLPRIEPGGIAATGSLYTYSDVKFEGSSSNANETTLTVTDPTADRTITLPDATGTVLLADGDGSSLTSVDAATLDSLDSTQFLRSDAADSFSQQIDGTTLELAGGVTYDPPGSSGSDTATDVGLALHSGQRIVMGDSGYIRTIIDATASQPLQFGQSGTGYFAGSEIYGGSQGVKLFYNTSTKLQTLTGGVSVTGELDVSGDLDLEGALVEKAYNLTGTALDPSNGTLQYKTLSANTTFTESFSDGESITLMIDDGSSYTVTWPTMTWASGSAPTLATSGYTTVVLWHRGGLYGAVVS